MIETLQALPDLTESWLESLRAADRELYEEMADSLIVKRARRRVDVQLPAGVSEVLSEVEISGKEIGAFRFAPVELETVAEQIAAYDRLIRQDYDVEGQIVFVGEYGAGYVFVSPQGVGLLDTVPQPVRIRALAEDFTSFLIAQANAYESYNKFIVKHEDKVSYNASAEKCAGLPVLARADVITIFDAQLTA